MYLFNSISCFICLYLSYLNLYLSASLSESLCLSVFLSFCLSFYLSLDILFCISICRSLYISCLLISLSPLFFFYWDTLFSADLPLICFSVLPIADLIGHLTQNRKKKFILFCLRLVGKFFGPILCIFYVYNFCLFFFFKNGLLLATLLYFRLSYLFAQIYIFCTRGIYFSKTYTLAISFFSPFFQQLYPPPSPLCPSKNRLVCDVTLFQSLFPYDRALFKWFKIYIFYD